LRDRLEDLRVKLQDVINLVMESNNQIAVAKAHGEEGKKNVDKAKVVIERARESLKVSKNDVTEKCLEKFVYKCTF
jgi:hypothetical protein